MHFQNKLIKKKLERPKKSNKITVWTLLSKIKGNLSQDS